jgi:hypothetical protein
MGLPVMREAIFDRNGAKGINCSSKQLLRSSPKRSNTFNLGSCMTLTSTSLRPLGVMNAEGWHRSGPPTHFTVAGNFLSGTHLLSKILARLTEADLNPCDESQVKTQ